MKANDWKKIALGVCLIIAGFCLASCSASSADEPAETFTVTIIQPASSDGSISVYPVKAEYERGDTVQINVSAVTGRTFTGWTGDVSGTSTHHTFSIEKSMTIGATFVDTNSLTSFQVSADVDTADIAMGSVTVSPGTGPYHLEDSVTFTATANTGYSFCGWYNKHTGTMASYNPILTVTLNDDKQMIAHFQKNIWTIMVYMDGDNDLETNAIDDLNEMEGVNLADSGITVITLFDRGATATTGMNDFSNGDWKGTRLIPIVYDLWDENNKYDYIASESVASAELGLTANGSEELNMADPATIVNFIAAAKRIAQAENYMIIFWDHGTGWRSASFSSAGAARTAASVSAIRSIGSSVPVGGSAPVRTPSALTDQYRELCYDETSDDILCTSEIGAVLAGKGISVVGFDLCLAGMLEVAYELRGCADYMVASPEVTPGDGWEYHKWLASFKAKSVLSGQALVDSIVSEYKARYLYSSGMNIAGYDLTKVDAVMTSFNEFTSGVEAYIRAGTNEADCLTRRNEIGTLLMNNIEDYYSVPGYLNLDVGSMGSVFSASVSATIPAAVKTKAGNLKTAVTSLVTAFWHDDTTGYSPNSTGLAVHLTELDDDGTIAPGSEDIAYFGDHASFATPPTNVPSFVDNAASWCPNSTAKTGLIWLLFYEADLFDGL